MTKLSQALQLIRDERGMTDSGLGELLGVHKTAVSRILHGGREVGRETVARLLVNLETDDIHRVLQAHFEDELERIRLIRGDKAAEYAAKVTDPTWPFGVEVSTQQTTRKRR